MELQLAHLCEELLGREWPGVNDPLPIRNDAVATALLAAVQAQCGAAPPLAEFLATPTIAALASEVRARVGPSPWQPLMKLYRRGRRRPLFLLPGSDGNPLNFHALAWHMAPERPVYGLASPGLGDEPPIARVEELAAAHVETILAAQPRGPYVLAGHCSGAIVALEIGLALERRGERVALLAVIDSSPPSQFYPLDFGFIADDAEFYVTIARGYRHWYGRELALDVEALLAVPPPARAAHFMALARAIDVFPADVADDRIARIRRLFAEFVANPYTPTGLLNAPIAEFRASDSPFSPDGAGWGEVTRGPVSVHERPGNHVSIVTEPHVGGMARALAKVIAEAEAT